MTAREYVHGYTELEATRLADQAGTLAELLHHDTAFPAGSRVLEAGCGVGAQTRILARRSPAAHFVSVDLSAESLALARAAIASEGLTNVELQQADLFALPFADSSFDHVFVCFVLEHLRQPTEALGALLRVLRPGGSLTVIEGDHGSAFFHPKSVRAQRTIECLNQAQAAAGGDALIGRRLYPLLRAVGLDDAQVSPRFVYADSSRPGWVDGFTRKTFIAMVEGAAEPALRLGLIDKAAWDEGIADLERSAGDEGTFCYTFFKAVAHKR
ncbi:MAG TPA: methyltransferase domain-containing protein [Polyangia bacterium]